MRTFSHVVCLAAILASVTNANWGFGKCPVVASIPYTNNMGAARAHKIISIDSTVIYGINMAKMLSSAIPTVGCMDLSTYLGGNFGYTSAEYQA